MPEAIERLAARAWAAYAESQYGYAHREWAGLSEAERVGWRAATIEVLLLSKRVA